MPKTVLLARPHPFIVAEMKPFLEENGYKADKLENLGNLPALARGAAGAIISLAVSSSVGESAEDVFLQLRKDAPRVPVLFASMLSLDNARPGIERIAKKAGVQANILGVDATSDAAAQLGRQETFLYFSKDDLASPERRVMALRLIRRHFR
jgi:hypothetical protein